MIEVTKASPFVLHNKSLDSNEWIHLTVQKFIRPNSNELSSRKRIFAVSTHFTFFVVTLPKDDHLLLAARPNLLLSSHSSVLKSDLSLKELK